MSALTSNPNDLRGALRSLLWNVNNVRVSDAQVGNVARSFQRELIALLASLTHEMIPVGWQLIETAPAEGSFMIALESCPHLAWPAHAFDGHIYSNAHGILNEPDHQERITRAMHWMPLPEPPPLKAGEQP